MKLCMDKSLSWNNKVSMGFDFLLVVISHFYFYWSDIGKWSARLIMVIPPKIFKRNKGDGFLFGNLTLNLG